MHHPVMWVARSRGRTPSRMQQWQPRWAACFQDRTGKVTGSMLSCRANAPRAAQRRRSQPRSCPAASSCRRSRRCTPTRTRLEHNTRTLAALSTTNMRICIPLAVLEEVFRSTAGFWLNARRLLLIRPSDMPHPEGKKETSRRKRTENHLQPIRADHIGMRQGILPLHTAWKVRLTE